MTARSKDPYREKKKRPICNLHLLSSSSEKLTRTLGAHFSAPIIPRPPPAHWRPTAASSFQRAAAAAGTPRRKKPPRAAAAAVYLRLRVRIAPPGYIRLLAGIGNLFANFPGKRRARAVTEKETR